MINILSPVTIGGTSYQVGEYNTDDPETIEALREAGAFETPSDPVPGGVHVSQMTPKQRVSAQAQSKAYYDDKSRAATRKLGPVRRDVDVESVEPETPTPTPESVPYLDTDGDEEMI